MKRIAMKEALITLALLAFGLLALPALIYLVGQFVLGPYEDEGGLYALYETIGSALVGARPGAWLLVLSPYLAIQLIRLMAWLHGRRPAH